MSHQTCMELRVSNSILAKTILACASFLLVLFCELSPQNSAYPVLSTSAEAQPYLAADSLSDFIPWPQRRPDVSAQVPSGKVADDKHNGNAAALFAAIDDGNWQLADKLQTALGAQHPLLGHALAERYLHSKSRPQLPELIAWLKAYGDYPQAPRIMALAQKRAATQKLQQKMQWPNIRPVSSWRSGADIFAASKAISYKQILADYRFSPAARPIVQQMATLATQSPLQALAAFERHSDSFNPTEQAMALLPLIGGFYYQGRDHVLRGLLPATEIVAPRYPQIYWFAGLAAYRQHDMAEAYKNFALLSAQEPVSLSERAAAHFWAARAALAMKDDDSAQLQMRMASQYGRSFYGRLALAQLGQSGDYEWSVPQWQARHEQALNLSPSGQRALALIAIGKTALAEEELLRLQPQAGSVLAEALLVLAEREQMARLALRMGGQWLQRGKIFDAALFPLPHWQPKSGFMADPALLFALMRQESRFEPAAESQEGAKGLMQLMPATAASLGGGRLQDPITNLTLGQSYVQRLQQKDHIGRNFIYLLTAYNWGPGNLARYLEQVAAIDTQNDPLLFLESLPVRETRVFVSHVLTSYWLYRTRMGQPCESEALLAKGEWPELRQPAAALRLAALN